VASEPLDTKYRLLFLDVDGTLLTSDQRITDRTRRAIDRAKQHGLRVSLSTGRIFSSAKAYADAVGADAPLILCNGARIQTPDRGEVLHEWRLDASLARVALDALKQWDVHVSLFHDEAIYIAEWNDRARESARKDGVTFVPVGDLASKLGRAPLKMMIIGDIATIDGLEAHLRSVYDCLGGNGPAVVRTEPTYLEIWNRDTSKGTAARWIADRLGIRLDEVIAFGDSLNDLDLLRSVGLGVAMANGHDELKRAVRRVASSNDQDGVAEILEEIAD
jgi:Cof subfamily protein (haloacid dehalogenase superfamily)